MSSSATFPPKHTSIWAFISFILVEYLSISGRCIVIPSDAPRGMMVTLCKGFVPGVNMIANACPASWYAVISFSFSDMTILFLSAPIITLSFAHSKSNIETA
jgi:hypothetical protein